MRLWMVTSLDRHFKSTAGLILVCLKPLFVFDNAESIVKGLLAMVQTFSTGPIRRTAGMGIVEEWHQPPMQWLYHGRYHIKPVIHVTATYVIRIYAIQRAAQRFPLMPLTVSSRWGLSNSIDLSDLNVFYKQIVQIDA